MGIGQNIYFRDEDHELVEKAAKLKDMGTQTYIVQASIAKAKRDIKKVGSK